MEAYEIKIVHAESVIASAVAIDTRIDISQSGVHMENRRRPVVHHQKPNMPTRVLRGARSHIIVILVGVLTTLLGTVFVGVWNTTTTNSDPLSATPTYPRPIICAAPDGYIYPASPREIKSKPGLDVNNDELVDGWVTKGGAVGLTGSTLSIALQGKLPQYVMITGVEFHVVKREPPMHGTVVEGGCGDMVPVRYGIVDLTKQQPIISYKFDKRTVAEFPGAGKPIVFPYAIASGDHGEYFAFIMNVKNCTCSWTATISWISQGKQGTTQVDNRGKPFITSSPENSPDECVSGYGRPWLCGPRSELG
jgi:hypothetical protein